MRQRSLVLMLAATAVSALVGPVEVLAQTPSRGDSCSYDECALRIRPGGWFSGNEVVRGREGVPVVDYGRSPVLEDLFASSDSAAFYYSEFSDHDRTGSGLGLIGGAAFVAGIIAHAGDEPGWSLGFYAGGLTFGLIASRPRRQARAAFSRAIWWYNRSLPER